MVYISCSTAVYTKVRTNKKAIISNFAINFPLLPVRFEFHYHRPPPPPLNRFACESFLPLLPPQPSFPFTTSSPPLKIPSPPTIIPFLFGFRYCATTDRLRPASRPHSPHLVENKLKRGGGGGGRGKVESGLLSSSDQDTGRGGTGGTGQERKRSGKCRREEKGNN